MRLSKLDSSKGGAPGLAVLGFCLLTIILSLFISTKVFLEKDVSTNVNARIDTRVNQFNSISALNTILVYNNNQRSLIKDSEDLSLDTETVEEKIKNAADYLIESQTETSGYSIKIEKSNREILSIEEGSTQETSYSTSAYLASPLKNSSTISVSIYPIS